MIGQVRILDGDDDAEIDALSGLVREWEPRLDLYRPPRDARLYDPDGTLYAVALGGGMTVSNGRRTLSLGAGDALVVPAGLALDVEPGVDMLAVRHDGTPPAHFRERFHQTQAFDHAPAPPTSAHTDGLTEVIARGDARFRLPYAVWDLPAGDGATPPPRSGMEALILIVLAGAPRLLLPGEGPDARVPLGPRMIVAVGPGADVRAEGPGRLGLLSLETELAHEARRRDRASPRDTA